jgi:hypothetical protein
MEAHSNGSSAKVTWTVIALLVLMILFKGWLAFVVVSDRGQPTWDYRPVADVPGESPYAIYRVLPHPQHVRGAKGE